MKLLQSGDIPTKGGRSEIDGDALRERGATVLLVVRLAGREVVWDIGVPSVDREPLWEDHEEGLRDLARRLALATLEDEITAELRVLVGDPK